MLAWVKNTSSLHLAVIGYLETLVCPSLSRNDRKLSRISCTVSFSLKRGLPMNVYSTHGASPQVSPSPRVQKNLPQLLHCLRWKPLLLKNSSS